jgi:hypothetical protein
MHTQVQRLRCSTFKVETACYKRGSSKQGAEGALWLKGRCSDLPTRCNIASNKARKENETFVMNTVVRQCHMLPGDPEMVQHVTKEVILSSGMTKYSHTLTFEL